MNNWVPFFVAGSGLLFSVLEAWGLLAIDFKNVLIGR
jgi:hypothetical protein